MTQLIFNDNYLDIWVPDMSGFAQKPIVGSVYQMKFDYMFMPTNDLQHEWAIHDFPGASALAVINLLAAPAKHITWNWDDPLLQDGWYWTYLYTPDLLDSPITVLSSTDSDRGLYAVAEEEQAKYSPLLQLRKAEDVEVWASVVISSIDEALDREDNQVGIYLELTAYGDSIASGWVQSRIELVEDI